MVFGGEKYGLIEREGREGMMISFVVFVVVLAKLQL